MKGSKMKRIAIHSVPRSGSTWLGSIFDAHPNVIYKLQPLFSYALKGFLGPESDKKEIDDFFSRLSVIQDDFMDQVDAKSDKKIPTFVKDKPEFIVYKEVRYHNILKNLLEKDTEIKVVGIIRNPLGVISSWLRAPKEFRVDEGWEIHEEWRNAPKKNLNKMEEFNGYEKWKEVLRLFEHLLKLYPARFYLLSYDDLLNNPQLSIEGLFSFCGMEMKKQVVEFIRKSTSQHQQDSYAVYKTKNSDDAWKKHLPHEIQEEILNDPDFIRFNNKYKWV